MLEMRQGYGITGYTETQALRVRQYYISGDKSTARERLPDYSLLTMAGLK